MKQKDIFYIIVSSFVVIVIWIIANLLHIQNTSKLSDSIIAQTNPITPSFDVQTLTKLKDRSTATPDFTMKTATKAAALTPVPTLLPTQPPVISPTVIPTPTETPTPTP